MKKICPSCKTKNEENTRFCITCGHKFSESGGRQGRLCPAGRHTMDPNWTQCPYCEAEARAQQAPPVEEPAKERKMRPKTSFGESEEEQSRRFTRIQENAPGGPPPPPRQAQSESEEVVENTARIVAVLISYSRRKGGEIFPVREGKTYIGSGETRFEAPADILFSEDRKMSSEHALIIYRNGKYHIYDQQSVNGTWVNGKDVQQAELPNYAQLRMGKTQFTFIKTEAAPSQEEVEEEPPIMERDRGPLI